MNAESQKDCLVVGCDKEVEWQVCGALRWDPLSLLGTFLLMTPTACHHDAGAYFLSLFFLPSNYYLFECQEVNYGAKGASPRNHFRNLKTDSLFNFIVL